MHGLCRYSIRHPIQVLVIALGVVLGIAPGAMRLQLRTDGHALVPTGAPEIRLDRAIRDEFGIEDPIVVLIRAADPRGIFNFGTLTLVDELTVAFRGIEGVRPSDIFSLATEHGHRVKPGTLKFRRFLEPLPTTDEQLLTLRDDLRAIQLYTGTLVSYDEQSTSVMVGTPHGCNRNQLYREINELVDQHRTGRERIDVIGAPVAEALLGTHLLEDLGVPDAFLGRGSSAEESPELHVPRSLNELRVLIARNVGLVPIAIAVMALVFLLCFRSLAAVLVPLSEVGASLVFVFALMGWCDVPIYLTIAVLPVILTAIGVADEIHIFARYKALLRRGAGRTHGEILSATMAEMWVPVVKTSVTTSVGFLSFALSPIGPVRAFGIFTAVGVIFCMFWSLTVVPAMLTLLKPGKLASHGGATAERAGVLAGFAGVLVRRRYLVLAGAVALIATAPMGVRRIDVQDSWIDGFAPSSAFYQATQRFNESFLGTHILLVVVDCGHELIAGKVGLDSLDHHTISIPASLVEDPQELVGRQIRLEIHDARPSVRPGARPGASRRRPPHVRKAWIEAARMDGDRVVVTLPRRAGSPRLAMQAAQATTTAFEITPRRLMQPEVLQRIDELTKFIRKQEDCAVGGALGTADYIRTTNFMSRALKEEERHIPDDRNRIDWLWGQYERIRGVKRARQLTDKNYSRGVVTVFMKDANFSDTRKLMGRIRDYEQQHLASHGMTLSLAGDVAVSQTLIGAIVSTQVRSLLLSLVGILSIAALLGRSLRVGVLAVVPCAVAVLMNFALMGWVGMPLGVATSMFAGMTLGIGVDYAIHLLERFRLARGSGLDVDAAVADAVSATGPAVIIDALAVGLGFGILILSQVPANARLGVLVVLSITGCLAATLVLMPALLRVFPPRAVSSTTPR